MSSMMDVAQRAGVSTATVSRVLANKPHVRPEVRARVLQAVEELGYRPNRAASNLRKQTSQVIGLMVSDIRAAFFTDVARAVEDVAYSQGYGVYLCNTDEDDQKENLYLKNLMSENVAGIIFSPTRRDSTAYRELLESHIPVVTIDRRIDGAEIDSVVSDNFQAAKRLTQHIISKGYRRIAALVAVKSIVTSEERMDGIQSALKSAGLSINREYFHFVRPNEQEGYAQMMQLVELPKRPDVVITGNSRLTIGVLDALSDNETSIGRDIGIAGFDETIWTPHLGGGITVISQPTTEMGKAATETLIRLINQEQHIPREIVFKSKLIERGSTQSLIRRSVSVSR